jgi:hypothetical protein
MRSGCVVFVASGTQYCAHSYPMQLPLPEGCVYVNDMVLLRL